MEENGVTGDGEGEGEGIDRWARGYARVAVAHGRTSARAEEGRSEECWKDRRTCSECEGRERERCTSVTAGLWWQPDSHGCTSRQACGQRRRREGNYERMEEGRGRVMVRGTVQTLLQADGTTDGRRCDCSPKCGGRAGAVAQDGF